MARHLYNSCIFEEGGLTLTDVCVELSMVFHPSGMIQVHVIFSNVYVALLNLKAVVQGHVIFEQSSSMSVIW